MDRTSTLHCQPRVLTLVAGVSAAALVVTRKCRIVFLSMYRELKPAVDLAPARAPREPKPMIVFRLHLGIPTTRRAKARWAIHMVAARTGTRTRPRQCEIDRHTLRKWHRQCGRRCRRLDAGSAGVVRKRRYVPPTRAPRRRCV